MAEIYTSQKPKNTIDSAWESYGANQNSWNLINLSENNNITRFLLNRLFRVLDLEFNPQLFKPDKTRIDFGRKKFEENARNHNVSNFTQSGAWVGFNRYIDSSNNSKVNNQVLNLHSGISEEPEEELQLRALHEFWHVYTNGFVDNVVAKTIIKNGLDSAAQENRQKLERELHSKYDVCFREGLVDFITLVTQARPGSSKFFLPVKKIAYPYEVYAMSQMLLKASEQVEKLKKLPPHEAKIYILRKLIGVANPQKTEFDMQELFPLNLQFDFSNKNSLMQAISEGNKPYFASESTQQNIYTLSIKPFHDALIRKQYGNIENL